jgi:hypothetical protein
MAIIIVMTIGTYLKPARRAAPYRPFDQVLHERSRHSLHRTESELENYSALDVLVLDRHHTIRCHFL